MNDFLNKISAYNLFNYLLPGILFVVSASAITHYSFLQHDLVVGVFLYYFIGLVVSRVGSLIVEPALKLSGFLKFADYQDFIAASKQDQKIELLSEVNNTYRTLCSLFLLLLFLKIYEQAETRLPALQRHDAVILAALLLLMFLFAYRKQTQYIKKRIEATRI